MFYNSEEEQMWEDFISQQETSDQLTRLQNLFNVQYMGPLYMGSSAQEVKVAYDTGSEVRHTFNYFVFLPLFFKTSRNN